MKPTDLTLYESPFKKIRIGKQNDGGYIITEIPNINYDLLLSGGIDNDISFEEVLCDKYNVKCLAFDGTINGVNTSNDNIKYIQKNIGIYNTENETNLFDIIDQYENIFLKMDIEGHEVDWVRNLTSEQLNKFSQMVIEFHFMVNDLNITFDINDVFEKINKTHYLLHFHANNCCHPLVNHNGVNLPNVFECTFINKKYITEPLGLNKDNLPTDLDMPNIAGSLDFYFDYPPFVNN